MQPFYRINLTSSWEQLIGEIVMRYVNLLSRRSILASALFVGLLPSTTLFAADKPSTITIDWATYNPVSILLKNQGLLEKEFAKDGIAIRWVQSAGSNKALEFLNAGSIDFGSTAGSAALVGKINGNDFSTYVAVDRVIAKDAVKRLNAGRIKGKSVKVRSL